jgi:hypothetical protein
MEAFACRPASVAPSSSDFGTLDDDDIPNAPPARGRATLVFEMPDASVQAASTDKASAAAASAAAGLPPIEEERRRALEARARVPVPPARVAPAVERGDAVEGRYVTLPSDTFSAVALRHGMTTDSLAVLNGMSTARCLMPGQVLRVHRPALSDADEEARRRREAVLRFRRQQQCSTEEALYYLESNSFEWSAAITERTTDVAWEREHKAEIQRREEETRAAETEAHQLVSALTMSASRDADKTSWPKWLRPWEDQLLRKCMTAN